MSDNVIRAQFGPRPTIAAAVAPETVDLTSLIQTIACWAEDHGVDVDNDYGFHVRLTDFMTYLELTAKESMRERKTA